MTVRASKRSHAPRWTADDTLPWINLPKMIGMEDNCHSDRPLHLSSCLLAKLLGELSGRRGSRRGPNPLKAVGYSSRQRRADRELVVLTGS